MHEYWSLLVQRQSNLSHCEQLKTIFGYILFFSLSPDSSKKSKSRFFTSRITSENIINFSKKFSVYKIEHIINILLFIIINFQKAKILDNNTKFYENNNNAIKDYNSKKLNFIYDKLINIKKNIDIIQNNETILFSICILFKKLSKAN